MENVDKTIPIKFSTQLCLPAPAVSVVIPMYNAEEYISECLESVLNQTFQSFEVIVVDDCSTDLSREVVESYIPQFDGRLRLAKTEVNSGGGSYVPRNVGFTFASGEYVWFVDADDFILLTALETLYNAAKEYDADVVYMSRRYFLTSPNKIRLNKDAEGRKLTINGLEDKPTLTLNDPDKNIYRLFFEGNFRAGWTKFIRRELLIKEKIIFPEIIGGGDYIWGIHVYCCAKRFLRLPTPLYFYRYYDTNSVTRIKKSSSEQISHWISAFVSWATAFNDLANKNEVLKNNPIYCYHALESEFTAFFKRFSKEIQNFSVINIYEILLNEFAKKNDASLLPMSFLFTVIAAYKKCILQNESQDTALEGEILPQPAISIIISLYNYGLYIGECLESILAQTFQDFEVIVVDDCSTDNSVSVVESYILKFNGRLKLTRTKENSGGGGEPRNLGFSLASGEYVFFMDADDVFTKTALEEMYTLAKQYDADVVYCEKYFMSTGRGEKFAKNIHPADSRIQKPPFVDKPELETDDMAERVSRAVNHRYWVTAWLRLVRRKLLLDNNIKFDSVIRSNDVSWTFKVLFCAKKFLRVPNACYIRRIHDESTSFRKRTPEGYIHSWMDMSVRALKDMDDFMEGIEFFRKNLTYRYKVLESFLNTGLSCSLKECKNLSKAEVYDNFRQIFGQYLGEYDVLVSCLYAYIHGNNNNTIIRKFKSYFTARVDIKFISKIKGSDFQIFSVSDDKAKISKPAWFQKGGVGYVIFSYCGKLRVLVKTNSNGQIKLILKGRDVRDPDNKSKRIPYWIDFTKLTVNGNVIFDELIPVWHDKSYRQNMNVKAGEEITVEVEWLPHRSDT